MKRKAAEPSVDDLMRMQESDTKRRLSTPPVHSSSSEDGESSDAHLDQSSDGQDTRVLNGLGDSTRQLDMGSTSMSQLTEWVDRDADDTAPSRISFKRKKQTTAAEAVSTPRTTTFASLGVTSTLISAMSGMSIRTPTEIQAACIPPLLAGRDCIGNAKTGSGKTIAFALPILQKLSVDPYGIFALILTPTRELAFQISEQFSVLGAPLNVRTAVIVGGMDMMAQAIELNNRPHIVVATPGRLVDHLQSSSAEWDISRVRFLVLDEADRILTPTFADDLGRIFKALPSERQTALFTATWTPSIDVVADGPPRPGKQKPFIHKISAMTETVETLKQLYILVPSQVREVYLFYLLTHIPEEIEHMKRLPAELPKSKRDKPGRRPKKASAEEEDVVEQPPPTMVFCGRARTAAYVTSLLQTLGFRTTALHSKLTQRERLTSLDLFRSGVVPILVSTDVGARGLDIEDVGMVVNWDLPDEPEEYTHRVGRTARAGRTGVAVSFVGERDEERVLRIEKRIKTRLGELGVPEGKVLESLNKVSTAKRQAHMEVDESGISARENVRSRKRMMMS